MMLPIGEVVLILVLFRHGVGGKVRPADFVAAPVTSQARVSGVGRLAGRDAGAVQALLCRAYCRDGSTE